MKNPQSICHEWRAETGTAFKYLSENYNPKLTQIDKKQRNLNVLNFKNCKSFNQWKLFLISCYYFEFWILKEQLVIQEVEVIFWSLR